MATEAKNSKDGNGIPGFSGRLNYLFDLAGAPRDTRQTWGSQKWKCVPNTVARWLKEDCPPKFSMLSEVVTDLLLLVPGRYDKTTTLAWLYTGQPNPFDVNHTSLSEPIDHVLQAKIYNRLYQMCDYVGENLDELPQENVNKLVSSVYWYLSLRKKYGLDYDPRLATQIMRKLLAVQVPSIQSIE